MQFVAMRHRITHAEAHIPAAAVKPHRALGWVPLDEWDQSDTPDTPDATEATEAPAATATPAAPRRRTSRTNAPAAGGGQTEGVTDG